MEKHINEVVNIEELDREQVVNPLLMNKKDRGYKKKKKPKKTDNTSEIKEDISNDNTEEEESVLAPENTDVFMYSDEELLERKMVTDQVQEDINFLTNELRKHSSAKITDVLLSTIEVILEHASIAELNIYVDNLSVILGYNKYERVIKRYKNSLFEHYKNMFKVNKILSYNVDLMFEENGSFPLGVNYKKLVDPYELAGEFFKYYDKDMYDFYNLELKRGHYFDWMLDPSTGGCTIDVPIKDKSYILINNLYDDNIMKATVVAHETIHAYFNHLKKFSNYDNIINAQINNLNEVYSTFIQLVFSEWLKKINFRQGDISMLDNYHKYLLKEFNESFSSKLYTFESFLDEKTLRDYYDNEGELENMENAFATSELLKLVGHEILPDELIKNPDLCNIEVEYPKGYTKYDAAYAIIKPEAYFYGYLLGYHFLEQYLEDPDKAKDNIARFTLDSFKKDKLELLDGYGLGLDNIKDTNKVKKLIYKKDCYK